jgi:HSP20 family molecular chaperone IbpA
VGPGRRYGGPQGGDRPPGRPARPRGEEHRRDRAGRSLTIRGERKEETEEKKEDYYYSERRYGLFARTLPLPAGVEADKVKATFKNGVLEVHLPKSKEAKGKKIEVKAG